MNENFYAQLLMKNTHKKKNKNAHTPHRLLEMASLVLTMHGKEYAVNH